jgi:RNA polymerase sigma factor (sigma-70 family)
VPSDFELLERWRAGDRAQGNELFRRHVRAVLRFFRNKVGSVAEDLAQRTFLAMVESRERFRGDASFRGYLFGVARNQLLMHLRGECRDRERFDAATWSVVDAGARPDRIATQQQEQALLLAALQRIPIDAQIAFELHYWEGLTIEEIAAVQGDPPGTIKARLSRGRTQMKEHLAALAPDAALLASAADNLERWARSLPALVEPARDRPP